MWKLIGFTLACLVGPVVMVAMAAIHIAACGAAVFSGLVFVLMLFASMGSHWHFSGLLLFIVGIGALCLTYEMTAIMSFRASGRRLR